MPPALQVDIPPEQAQQILEKRSELGPYIFREAQVVCLSVCFLVVLFALYTDSVPAQITVFNQLLKFWPEFQELRKGTREEQLLLLLQEKRIKHIARVRRRRRKEEEEEEESRRAQVRTC